EAAGGFLHSSQGGAVRRQASRIGRQGAFQPVADGPREAGEDRRQTAGPVALVPGAAGDVPGAGVAGDVLVPVIGPLAEQEGQIVRGRQGKGGGAEEQQLTGLQTRLGWLRLSRGGKAGGRKAVPGLHGLSSDDPTTVPSRSPTA